MAVTLASAGAAVAVLVDSKNHLVTAAAAMVAAGLGAIAPVAVDAYQERKRDMKEAASVRRRRLGHGKNLPLPFPSSVLDPHRQVIPFGGRNDEVKKLVAWCKDKQAGKVRLITGAGGVGKTRLAVRLAELMAKDGWKCWWIEQNKETNAVDAFRNVTSKRLLLIVDYAEVRPGLSNMLKAATDEGDSRLRVLLLARQAGDWWQQLQADQQEVRDLVSDADRNLVELPEAIESGQSAIDVIRQAIPLFAKELDSPTPNPNLVTITGDLHSARVLDLHASAVIAILSYRDSCRSLPSDHAGKVNVNIDDVLRQLLGHEKEYWRGRAQALNLLGGPHGLTMEKLSQVVAAGCLLGAANAAEMMDLLSRVPGVEPSSTLAAWLRELYPPGHMQEWLGSLRPDRLAELHVTLELDRRADFADACLTNLSERQARRALILLARASSEHEAARRMLEPALFRFAEVLPGIEAPQEALIAIAHAIPYPSLALNEARTAVVTRIIETFPVASPERAKWLVTNSESLWASGRLAKAQAAANEATAIYRRLSEGQPDAFLYGLSTALENQSRRSSGLGHWQDALTAADEAVTIRRKLKDRNSYAFLPALAVSLRNQSQYLSNTGRWYDALNAASEAVMSHRTLAEVNPDVFSISLVMSLGNQSQLLSAAGQIEEALAMADEAVKISRVRAEGRPDAELSNLAWALEIQSQRLSDLQQRNKALDAATEAVMIRRRLADRRPDTYLPRLAGALINLSRQLSNMGRKQDAADAADEAVMTYQELVKDHPDTFLTAFASALENQSLQLSRVGKWQEALDSVTEAVKIRRRLAGELEVYLAGLASSLENQSQRLTDAGLKEKSLDAINEAVAIRRQIAETGWEPHESAIGAGQSELVANSEEQATDNDSDLT